MTNITRHPLHLSVLESFAELRANPDEQQAGFTATISRILTDAFLTSDKEHKMPAFLTDTGVSILRMAMDDIEVETAPGASEAIGPIMGEWHEMRAINRGQQTILRSGRFALCEAFRDLESLICDETLATGGVLGFFDPIYEGSLILVQIKQASRERWIEAVAPTSTAELAA